MLMVGDQLDVLRVYQTVVLKQEGLEIADILGCDVAVIIPKNQCIVGLSLCICCGCFLILQELYESQVRRCRREGDIQFDLIVSEDCGVVDNKQCSCCIIRV